MLHNSGKLRSICISAQKLRLTNCKLCVNRSGQSALNLLQIRTKKDDSSTLSSLFQPVPVKPTPDDINVGAELTGSLNKADLLKVLNKFYQMKEIKQLLTENGLDRKHLKYLN